MPDLLRPTWEQFEKIFRARWKQGEHVFINGQTGSGKTDILMRLLDMPWSRNVQKYSTLFVTKPRDPIFRSPLVKHWERQTAFSPSSHSAKILLAPPNGDSTKDQVGNQHAVFSDALDTVYAQRGWTLGIDETLWIGNRLNLGKVVGDMAFMGRALGITGVYATQRPSHIPVIVPQSATHTFTGKIGRKEDMARIAELGGDFHQNRDAILSLKNKHDFVYIDSDGKLPLMIVNTHA